jgi:hypothetical protein
MAKKIKSLGGRSLKPGISKKADMGQLLKEAQKAQVAMESEMAELEEKLALQEVKASSGGGVVTVTAGGDLKIKNIDISPELQGESIDIIKDMIIAATNEALEKASELKETESEKISQKYLSGFENMPNI